MQLTEIRIQNYRSIEDLRIDLSSSVVSQKTYGLIGINEAGKSSILHALGLISGASSIEAKSFRDIKKPISIVLRYARFSNRDVAAFNNFFLAKADHTNQDENLKSTHTVAETDALEVTYSCDSASKNIQVKFQVATFEIINTPDEISSQLHKAVFWTADDNYLLTKPISFSDFAANPDGVSIPLKNCFLLSGLTDISDCYGDLMQGDSTEAEHLAKRLGKSTTKHINSIWPGHPIKISFLISDGKINFHVNDLDSDAKPKTVSQRSDGFKQLISFLLTISVQQRSGALNNTILLLDEPERHLHPKAQIYFLQELLKLSESNSNLILYATHSNYLINRENLNNTICVTKTGDRTVIRPLEGVSISYSRVNYEVFEIESTDYHNELYAQLQTKFGEEKGLLEFDKEFFQSTHSLKADKPFKEQKNKVSVHTYVRNCIHHPENSTYELTPTLLKDSIRFLHGLVHP
jgi:AAA15 family ATPase/GTPase